MLKKISLSIFIIFSFFKMSGQNINIDEYEIYIGDTLISKSDFAQNSQILDKVRAEKLQFKPISDGNKKAYYLNGKIYSIGKIENLKESGFWEYWYPNGNKAREGEFINGKPNGTHKYWYEDGKLRAIGNWKNGAYNGIWEMYKEDGEKLIQNYKEGKLIK